LFDALFDLEVLMRTMTTRLVAPLVLVLGISVTMFAQERHAVAPADLAAAVSQHTATLDADRDAVREALNRPEMRAVAERAGLNIDSIAASVDTLDPATLERAAASARDVSTALVGGASTVTISTTTIILVLLLIILLLVVR
jgi:hypothetical protein